MRRCVKCVMPSTRPDIGFRHDGTCSACDAHEHRVEKDWSALRQQFLDIIAERRTHSVYDCLVASSGGKDSHAIALTMREWGLRPLVFTVTPDFPTPLGRKNLENLRRLGFDYVEFTPDVRVRRKLNRLCLLEVGDIEWPEHALIFSSPVAFARDMGIGAVVFGENPQNDISGGDADAIYLTKAWREEYGGLLGLRPRDLIGREGITEKDMAAYEWPEERWIWGPDHDSDDEDNPEALFLGQFVPWDGWGNAELAKRHGFTTYDKPVEGNLWDFENLDNAIIGIHYLLAWVKFGFIRAEVVASFYIRHGRRTREEALAACRPIAGWYTDSYLGVPLAEILSDIGLTQEQFDETVDRFANTRLMERISPGRWKLKEEYAL